MSLMVVLRVLVCLMEYILFILAFSFITTNSHYSFFRTVRGIVVYSIFLYCL